MDPHQKRDIHILASYQGNRKHHQRLPLNGFPHIQPDLHKEIQPHPPTTDISIVPHQKSAKRHYLLDIIASGRLEATNDTTEATDTKKYGNWDRWCILITHSGITDKLLGVIPPEHKTTLVSSFNASVQRNQFGTSREKYSSAELSNTPYQMYLRLSGRALGET